MSGAEKPMAEKSVQDFLLRWSRRKLGVADPDDHAQEPAPPSSPQRGEAEAAPPAEAPPDPAAAFDPKSLPPLESIDATTDIRAFLAPGVPAELTRAALRRAWTSDPAIRDFVGIAENQWDFTNPDSVPGFGSLELDEEIRGMVARLFGETPAEAQENPAQQSDSGISERAEQVNIEAAEAEASTSTVPKGTVLPAQPSPPDRHVEGDDARQSHSAAGERNLTPHRHGRALPK